MQALEDMYKEYGGRANPKLAKILENTIKNKRFLFLDREDYLRLQYLFPSPSNPQLDLDMQNDKSGGCIINEDAILLDFGTMSQFSKDLIPYYKAIKSLFVQCPLPLQTINDITTLACGTNNKLIEDLFIGRYYFEVDKRIIESTQKPFRLSERHSPEELRALNTESDKEI